MKKLALISVFAIFFGNLNMTHAREYGAGFVLGNPTALVGNYWADNQTSYVLGLSFASSDYVLLYGDYLKHYSGFFKGKDKFTAKLTPYLGIGGILVNTTSGRASNDKFLGTKSGTLGLGIRVPVGAEWNPDQPNIGVFGEIVPGISIMPSTDIIFEIGLGIRYYF